MRIPTINTKTELNAALSSVLNEIHETITRQLDFKPGKNLLYWLNDWNQNFLVKECSFDSRRLLSYSRGDVVLVHFGFNIGSEQGGLHYGIVLDNDNERSNGTVMVLPLRSLKEGETEESINSKCQLCIGNDFFKSAYDECIEKRDKLKIKIEMDDAETDSSKVLHPSEKRKIELNIKEMNKNIAKLSKKSVALFSQIRAVSKMRIYDPKHSSDLLYNVRVSDDILDIIDLKIIGLYMGPKIAKIESNKSAVSENVEDEEISA